MTLTAFPPPAAASGRLEEAGLPADRPVQRSRLWLVGLVALLLFQATLLASTAHRDITPFVPLRFDQAAYLTETYRAYEQMRERGFLRGLFDTVRARRAQGWLLQPEAASLFVVLGPSRMTALAVNLAHFLVYLAVTFVVVRRCLGLPAALFAAGLMSAVRTTTIPAGGAFDFRLDFAAYCIWGIWLALLAFLPPTARRWVWGAVGLVGAWLILHRLIAATYVLPIVFALAVVTWLAFRRYKTPDLAATRIAAPITLVALVVLLGALIARNWDSFAGYYIQGHLLGEERKLRALDAGVVTLADNLAYYPNSAFRDHFGREAAVLAILAILACVVSASLLRSLTPGPSLSSSTIWFRQRPVFSTRWTVASLLLAVAVPYAVLTMAAQKSPVTGNFLIAPLILLATAAFAALANRLARQGPFAGRAVLALGALTLAGGLLFELDRVSRPQFAPASRADVAAATRMSIDIGDYLANAEIAAPRWGTDAIIDVLASGTSEVHYYEQQGIWLGIEPGLGHAAIDATFTLDQIMAEADRSDVLVLTKPITALPPARYPLEKSIEAARPGLREYAEDRLVRLGQYRFFGREASVFVRPSVKVIGATPDRWFTEDGFDVLVGPEGADRAAALLVAGSSDTRFLPPNTTTSATIVEGPASGAALPTRFEIARNGYQLTVDLTGARRPPDRTLRLHIDFSDSFVNPPDPRKLVVMVPTRTRVELARPIP